jgi:hypothetical protein
MHTIRFIILLSLTLIFSGCHEDKITDDTTEVINPPDKIGTVNIEGITKNIDGVILRNTEISVYQNNKKVGTVFSNNDGFYTIKTLPIDPDQDVTLEYKKDDLSIKYRRFTVGNSEKIISNPLLGKAESADVTQVDTPLANPSDTNFVKLYGYTLLADGTPVRGVNCHAAWDFQILGTAGFWVKEGNRDFSDENGYFEILVPKNKSIYFNTSYLRYPEELWGQCYIEFQNIVSNPLEKWRYNLLGNFSKDQEIFLRNDINIELNMVVIKGRALYCDGTPLSSGNLWGYLGETLGSAPTGIILPGNSFRDSNYVFGPNGEFEFYLEGCKRPNSNYGYGIIIKTNEFEGRSVKFDLLNPENFETINLCIDNRDFPDEFNLKLGNDPLKSYPLGGDNATSGVDKLYTGFSLDYVGDLGESVYFATESVALGIQPIIRLEMWKLRKTSSTSAQVYETTFDAKPKDVVLNFTKIEDNYVYGTINGNVSTPQGKKSIDITFKIYNK